MNIITAECNVPYYTEISFRLWSTELKEKLDEKVIPFNQVRQDELLADWRNRFGDIYFLQHATGFRHANKL